MRNSTRVPVDLQAVQCVTHRNKEFIKRIQRQLADFAGDTQRKKRLAARECLWCFYFHSVQIAGQAFTTWNCSACDVTDSHHNTATPRLCDACSDKRGLCVRCTADLDLKNRRYLFRKARS